MRSHRWSWLVLTGTIGALSACDAGASSTPAVAPIPAALARVMPNRAGHASSGNTAMLRGWLSQRAKTGKSLVYVASNAGSTGAVYVYATGGQGQAPIGAIVDGVAEPAGLAVDSAGSLYVSNSAGNTVTVYPPGKLSPSATYTQGVSAPQGVAVGSDGTMYIANETGSPSGTGSVTEYAPGSKTPSKTIVLPGMYAFAVGLDASNNLYVSWFDLSSYGIQIYEYAPGSIKGTNLNLDLPEYVFPAFAIAFDHRGNLVIPVESLDHNPPKYIEFFPPGATEPSRKIDEAGLLDVVEGIAFPKGTRVFYVASASDHDWMKLTMHKAIPRDVVQVPGPWGLALSP
jgi:hypothetical protein